MARIDAELASVAPSEKKDKKKKREKGEHKSKKRHLEVEAELDGDHKHKRSKNEIPPEDGAERSALESARAAEAATEADVKSTKKDKKDKKKKRRSSQVGTADDAQPSQDTAMTDVSTGQLKNESALEEAIGEQGKAGKKKHKHHRHHDSDAEVEAEVELGEDLKADPDAPIDDAQHAEQKAKKHKKKRHSEEAAATTQEAAGDDPAEQPTKSERKKRKEERKKERERRGAEAQEAAETSAVDPAQADQDAMDVDSSTKGPSSGTFGKLPEKPFPFFRQTIAQYLPLFPQGMVDPVEGFADQHLKPLLNRYVPTLKGVLLGYRKARIGEAPGQGSLTERSTTDDEVLLESIAEYAVSYGWLTAEVDLFKPSRGAWLEGSINLQTEGHLGVVCWGMFNASIEAARLPQGWRWVDLLSKNGIPQGDDQEAGETQLPTPDPFEDGTGDVAQVHTTGYWVDENGQRVRGTLRFRVKNYEVGTSGDYGYLSIEGTMLDEGAEKKMEAEEMETSRRRKLRHGAAWRTQRKRIPELSMTKFGADQEEEHEANRAEIWKGSRPGSETAE